MDLSKKILELNKKLEQGDIDLIEFNARKQELFLSRETKQVVVNKTKPKNKRVIILLFFILTIVASIYYLQQNEKIKELRENRARIDAKIDLQNNNCDFDMFFKNYSIDVENSNFTEIEPCGNNFEGLEYDYCKIFYSNGNVVAILEGSGDISGDIIETKTTYFNSKGNTFAIRFSETQFSDSQRPFSTEITKYFHEGLIKTDTWYGDQNGNEILNAENKSSSIDEFNNSITAKNLEDYLDYLKIDLNNN